MKLLVTGAAGFIGMHTSRRLLEEGHEVVGLDNLNDYYDPGLKLARLRLLQEYPNFSFVRMDVGNKEDIQHLFKEAGFKRVIHLAAQAGVRYSLANPHAYIDANLAGFTNILEGCRHSEVEHLVYASSSSVYGGNTKLPFSETDSVDHPVSLYAATKKANELMAHTYSHLFGLRTTGLRFFTVYGPWGRPDMALFLFVDAILKGRPIRIFNEGRMKRDFTYIDDVIESLTRILEREPQGDAAFDPGNPNPDSSSAPYRILNVGNSDPVDLLDFVAAIERATGRSAVKELHPLQAGDVPDTYASTRKLEALTGFRPATDITTGVTRFVEWYRDYYGSIDQLHDA